MLSSGYVYVLLNPSIQGVVKIGMTTRDPENRVTELSNATGVATPFILVYKEYFNDCHFAEKQIHTYLEQRNYRVANNREFFSIPVHEAINIIQNLKSQQKSSSNEEEYTSEINSGSNDISQLAESMLEEAKDYYYGNDGKLEDYDEALKLFKKSAKMGASESYWYLGNIYRNGDGVNSDLKIAMDYYKEGVKAGWVDCYAVMGSIYSLYPEYKHMENSAKCWSSYFANIANSNMKILYIGDYVSSFLINGWEIDNKSLLARYKNGVIAECEKSIHRYKTRNQDEFTKYTIKKYEQIQTFFKYLKEEYISEFVSGEGVIDNLFNVDGKAVLIVDINKGEFSIGDQILIQGGIMNLKSRINHIEMNRNLVDNAIKGQTVGFMIDGKYEEYGSIQSGWIVAKIK
ncbi:hypothetical protein GCM10008018_66140 [Paenibacillus marchantiophytorum]|uniref:Bacteriophage T5 Orf172 DNA-binding domain-containing protein n=2 Tax=Paenibacillus marchantiophytorum TaxID=1619310 RepID=A0ABQ1FG95_9BACL|nr:hypothetical protein GCM10008018_66140 [Paenibacillus marchantiophytorum]